MKTSPVWTLAVLAAALAFSGCTMYPPITGSGVLVEGKADFQGFSVLKAEHAFQVTVVADEAWSVTVTVDDNILEYLRLEAEGNALRIGLDPWHSYRDATLKALVTMPQLEGVELSGASSLTVVGGDAFPRLRRFQADVGGASSLLMPAVAADTLELELSGASAASLGLRSGAARFAVSGASHLAAGGGAGAVAAEVSGASEADLKALFGGDGDLRISGASRVWVNLSGLVDAEVSGGSTLYYRGGLSWGRLEITGSSQLEAY